MNRSFKFSILSIIFLALAMTWLAYQQWMKSAKGDPLAWQQVLTALEMADPAQPGAILFIGNSGIQHSRALEDDMQALNAVRRELAGANSDDVLRYIDRLMAAESPAAIVLLMGVRDLYPVVNKEPSEILGAYRRLIVAIRRQHGDVPVYFVGITPTIEYWEHWPLAEAANSLIEADTRKDTTLGFIDTDSVLLDAGVPIADYFSADGRQLNEQGYGAWSDLIKSRLIEDLASKEGRKL